MAHADKPNPGVLPLGQSKFTGATTLSPAHTHTQMTSPGCRVLPPKTPRCLEHPKFAMIIAFQLVSLAEHALGAVSHGPGRQLTTGKALYTVGCSSLLQRRHLWRLHSLCWSHVSHSNTACAPYSKSPCARRAGEHIANPWTELPARLIAAVKSRAVRSCRPASTSHKPVGQPLAPSIGKC